MSCNVAPVTDQKLPMPCQYGVLTRDEGILQPLIEGILQGQCAPGAHYRCPGHRPGSGLQGACRRRLSATCHHPGSAGQCHTGDTGDVPSVHYRVIGKQRLPCGGAREATQVMPVGTSACAAELLLMGTASGAAPSPAPRRRSDVGMCRSCCPRRVCKRTSARPLSPGLG